MTLTIPAFNDTRITSDSSKPNFQKVTAPVTFSGPYASAKLVVDLSSTCYPFSGWSRDPPPMGQNWPADCDAFDRNFEFTLDEPKSKTDPPAIELVRAITPFGGPEHFEIDVTDVLNGRPGSHVLQAYIATWSDSTGQVSGSNGGWNVSAHFEVVPGAAPHNVLAVIPLFNGTQGTPLGSEPYFFKLPAGTTSTRLEYRVTGHGGAPGDSACIGPAEEFCSRTHILKLDNAQLAQINPWRTDCATLCTIMHYGPSTGGFDYCAQNPCGDPQSVMAPRANWCPGSVTPPFTWTDPMTPTSAGLHSFQWSISNVDKGGIWRISAVMFAFGG